MVAANSDLWRSVGENFACMLRNAPGYEAWLTPQASLILSGEPMADLNYAVIDAGPQSINRLQQFAGVFQTRNVPLTVLCTEDVTPSLTPIAQTLGLKCVGEVPLMTCYPEATLRDGPAGRDNPAAAAPHPDETFYVEQGIHPQDVQEADRVAATAFGFPVDALTRVHGFNLLEDPRLTLFLTRQKGKVVSTVYTIRRGATVCILTMATLSEYRRQGAGFLLLNHVMAYHGERGANCFYLLATASGRPLYERAGFRQAATATAWVSGLSKQV